MKRAQTIVQLTEDLRDELDRLAEQRGTSRSALIRTALEAYLADVRDDGIARQIVEGYRSVPQTTPDAWGAPASEAERATVETMQRLDDEERAAGHRPW